MVRKTERRISRAATDEERARHAALRKQIEEELPEIEKRAKEHLDAFKREGTPLRRILSALCAERKRQGLSLADIHERTGIDRSALSRLENNEDANPTLNTLERYAAAVGKELVVVLANSEE